LKYCFETKDEIDGLMGDAFMSYCVGVCPQKLLHPLSKKFVSHFIKAESDFFNHFKQLEKTKELRECWNYLMNRLLKFHGEIYDLNNNQKVKFILKQDFEKDFLILKYEMTIAPNERFVQQQKMSSQIIIKL